MKVRFVLNCGLYSKTGKWVLSRKRDNVSNSGYEKNSYYNFDFKKSFKLGIVVLVMLNKILVTVFIIDFYSGYGPGSQKPSLSICAYF